MESLKEWASVVRALECGDQTVILRKGGILEAASGFNLESKRFFLFPTFEHQQLNHLKPQYQNYIQIVKESPPKRDHNRITSYAEVLHEVDVASEEKVNALSSFHILSDAYIKQRIDWMPEKSIKAAFLKVYKIPEMEIPLKVEYQGCKSWININEDVIDGQAVLAESDLDSRLAQFKEIVN